MIDHVDIKLERQDTPYQVQMAVYTDGTYATEVTVEYGITVPDFIYFGLSLLDGTANLVLSARKCWATPSQDPDYHTNYVFIHDFCSAEQDDEILVIRRNGVGHEVQVSLQSFEFLGDIGGSLYLHCQVKINSVTDVELFTKLFLVIYMK